jgi:hypothetical protein
MFKVTNIMTLPPESTVDHWVYPTRHCDKINEVWTKRIYGERFYSDDGKVFTSVNIWESKEAYQEFLDHPETQEVTEMVKAWRAANNCAFEKIEEDI